MPSTHISIRVTEQRRANMDALAAIIRSDSDAATIDWALGFALAHLDRQEDRMFEEWEQERQRDGARRMEREAAAPANIHRYIADDGSERFGLGVWNEANAQYQRPFDAEERRLTGCDAEYARRIEAMPAFRDLAAAQSRASVLFGYARLSQ